MRPGGNVTAALRAIEAQLPEMKRTLFELARLPCLR
jgi:hypothetical protein